MKNITRKKVTIAKSIVVRIKILISIAKMIMDNNHINKQKILQTIRDGALFQEYVQ